MLKVEGEGLGAIHVSDGELVTTEPTKGGGKPDRVDNTREWSSLIRGGSAKKKIPEEEPGEAARGTALSQRETFLPPRPLKGEKTSKGGRM